MDQAKLKHHLEIATNIAVLSVAIVVLGTFVWKYFTPKSQIQLQAGLQKGTTFAQLPGVDYSNAPKTLLIALSSKCDHCSESLPFYKQVTDKQSENINASHIVAIFPDTQSEVEQFTRQKDLNLDTVAGVDFQALNLIATPTVLLVDNSGKIIDFWIGKLSKDAEQEIIRAIS
jgi:thioredoxin-related protein